VSPVAANSEDWIEAKTTDAALLETDRTLAQSLERMFFAAGRHQHNQRAETSGSLILRRIRHLLE